jgi:hypothetical protein
LLTFKICCPYPQYPNIVPLQAIVGQSAGQAPSQADQAAATAAASVATNVAVGDDPSEAPSAVAPATMASGTFSSYNPMAWLSSPVAPVAVDAASGTSDVASKADVAV